MVLIPDYDESHLSALEVESNHETDPSAAIQFELPPTLNKRRQLLLAQVGSSNDPDVVSNSQPLIYADPEQKRLVMTYD